MAFPILFRIIQIEHILKSSFGLNKTELHVLRGLLDAKEEKTIKEISTIIGKDRTTAQRAVKRLFETELLTRRQLNLQEGGYVLIYAAKSKKDLRDKIFIAVESFKEMLGNEL